MPNLRHAFVSGKADGADPTVVKPSDWNAPLQFTDANGVPKGTAGLIRESLAADRTYYVRTGGANLASHTGLADTDADAFATVSYALTRTVPFIDCAGFTLRIKVADGTYNTDQIVSFVQPTGDNLTSYPLVIEGNTTTPANCVIDVSALAGYEGIVLFHPDVKVMGFKIVANTYGFTWGGTGGPLTMENMEWGSCPLGHIFLAQPVYFDIQNSHRITGTAAHFILTESSGTNAYLNSNCTVTVVGTHNFSTAFVAATSLSLIESNQAVIDISAATVTGKRYDVDMNAVIKTKSGGANYFPGDQAGITATGGQYIP